AAAAAVDALHAGGEGFDIPAVTDKEPRAGFWRTSATVDHSRAHCCDRQFCAWGARKLAGRLALLHGGSDEGEFSGSTETDRKAGPRAPGFLVRRTRCSAETQVAGSGAG